MMLDICAVPFPFPSSKSKIIQFLRLNMRARSEDFPDTASGSFAKVVVGPGTNIKHEDV